MKNQLFIAIDGIDGTGKSTQVEILAEELRKSGREVMTTKEPGGTAAGYIIRSLLLNKEMTLDPNTELLLFCADRAEHQHKIKNFFDDGFSVVSDRFLPSTWAYQIFGRKMPSTILELVIPETVKVFPDLTIILDMDEDEAIKRASARLAKEGKDVEEGRFEAEDLEFFKNVRKGFHWYASQSQFGKSVVIDASGSIIDVAEKIYNVCRDNLEW